MEKKEEEVKVDVTHEREKRDRKLHTLNAVHVNEEKAKNDRRMRQFSDCTVSVYSVLLLLIRGKREQVNT